MDPWYKEVLVSEKAVKEALGPMYTLNYSYVYEFEKMTDGVEDAFHRWCARNLQWSVYISLVYIMAAFAGQKYMSTRKPLDLRPALVVWNAVLAVFSIGGACRMLPDLIHTLTNYSFYNSVCHPNYFEGITGFWAIAFFLSKTWELGDTIFIILRKQPLILLHWYHHMSVLVYTWYIYTGHEAGFRWGTAMNYGVHSIMYTYYALRALRFRPPRWISVAITSLQIVQMVIGLYFCVYLYFVKRAGTPCQATSGGMYMGIFMYISYLVLFVHYFYSSYIGSGARKPAARVETKETRVASDVRSALKSVADIERTGYVKKDN